ncbi:MAG TPA: response regulator transcription factor [Bryobacteraceae bacterium]|nr:response regulator transcription factor [Bryobacteraceae bacterium]
MESQGAILLAEDDTELCSMMAEFFSHHGFEVEAVHNGRDAIRHAVEGSHDLLILDVMMPVLDGFEALRQIRRRSAIPVIMLTARIAPSDRIEGLNTGADDYLPKPFAPEELLARVRAVLRRSGRAAQSGETLECGSLRIRPATRQAWLRGEPVPLTSIEFDILDCLAHAAGRVVSRDALTAALYQREASPFERSLDVHVSHLRKKLDNGEEMFIHTVRGTGYMLASRQRTREGEQ